MTLETRSFDTETDKIFRLMVNSLYESKEIFLRELVSNASDACDKLRYRSLTEKDLLADDAPLQIEVSLDEEAKTLTISDNGIGMGEAELIENLGMIARSGTQRFLDGLDDDGAKENQLIGQFGVGFYSVFMVADSVEVTSRAAGQDQTWFWASEGAGSYQIGEAEAPLDRQGTTVVLHLKEEGEEFADRHRVEHVLKTYSSHIGFDVTFTSSEGEAMTINQGAAIWARSKSEISPEEYQEFYKSLSYMGNEKPWMILHNHVEGMLSYKSLLYIPEKRPFDLYHPDRDTSVKLYIKRVFIAESLELVPRYLRFLRGVIDSEDLPLNISRETVQNNQVVAKIRLAITKKVLSELAKRAKNDAEDYQKFWATFGAVIKEGLCEAGNEPKEDILTACRFASTDSQEQVVSLVDYVGRMKENQEKIYYITGDDYASSLASPQLEGFKKRDIEVLLLTDSVDEFWVNVVSEFDGKSFASVTRGAHDLDEIVPLKGEEAKKAEEKAEDNVKLEPLVAFFRETLDGRVSDVCVTSKLADSPVCITVPEGAMDIRLERFMVDNKQLAESTAKVLEVNPDHAIIAQISQRLESGDESGELADLVHLLFAQANVIEGEPVVDIRDFTRRMNHLIEQTFRAA